MNLPARRRVLFLRSNPVAPDPRVEKEALALQTAGYEVAILGWDRSAALPLEEMVAGMPIRRLPIRAEYASGMRNLPALLRWQAGLLGELARRRGEVDILHACDFDTILPALLCARLFGKRVVYDIFDFYADHLRRTPEAFKNLIRRLDRAAIRRADALILADDSRWVQIGGLRPPRSAVIVNSPPDDLAALQATAAHPPSAPPGLRLAYIGLLQAERGLFELMDVLAAHPEWELDLAGFGGDERALLEQAAGLPNLRWHGRVPYRRALELSHAADALLATYDPAIPNHRYSSPNKLFEAMMLARPVIVAAGTNMDQIVERCGCGLVIPYGDRPALEAALRALASDPARRQALGSSARRLYEAEYAWPRMQQRLVELYTSLP